MNNKFFADKNDFFKYDLLLELMENSPFLNQLTFIPMLTRSDDRKGGKLTSYEPGKGRQDLFEFLQTCLNAGRRDICQLRGFFATRAFRYTAYRDSTVFSNKTRDEYFAQIPETTLQNALIFLDPDNGLTDSMDNTDDKHLAFDELRGVYFRAADLSILVVYYHLPRAPREKLFQSIHEQFEHFRPRPKTLVIFNNRIAFVSLTKTSRTRQHVETILSNYASRTGLMPGVWSSIANSYC